MLTRLHLEIYGQPDDTTCGPTCLHAVYQYYNAPITLQQVINEVSYLEDGGTLAVLLGCHALKRGFKVTICTYDLKVFDPTWFHNKDTNLIDKLLKQQQTKKNRKLKKATSAYIDYLRLGGQLIFENLTTNLLRKYFKKNIPVLAGLSATYLYQCSREYSLEPAITVHDDIKGEPAGHFVVLCGYDEEKNHIVIADPYKENPVSGNNYYSVHITRLINAILLGIVTYDANLLVIEKKEKHT